MSSLVLAAGLGAYVAALEYHMMWPQYVQTTRDVQVRKAGLRALRDGIVDAYLQSAEAAGWKARDYFRKEVFQECLRVNCPNLPGMAFQQLTHAFIIRVRDGGSPLKEPLKIAA